MGEGGRDEQGLKLRRARRKGVGESEPYIAGGGAKATAMAGIDGRAAQGAEAMEIFCRKTLCRVWPRC